MFMQAKIISVVLGILFIVSAAEALSLSITQESAAPQAMNWNVVVNSPYPYDYVINGNTLYLTLHVNYTARNSCYGIEAEASRGDCTNCYKVLVHERKPRPDEMCAEVIRQIPDVTVKMELSEENKNVYINVLKTTGIEDINTPIIKPGIPIDCIKMEAEIVRLQREFQKCLAGECENINEFAQKLEELKRKYREQCKKEPPKVPPIEPVSAPPKKPIIILPEKPIDLNMIKLPVKIKREDGKIIIESNKISITTDVNLEVIGDQIISTVSKKPIDLNVDRILERVRKTIKLENVVQVELRDNGEEPVYEIKGESQGRLFGIIPVKLKVETKVSATTGDVLGVKKPWWSFLVWG